MSHDQTDAPRTLDGLPTGPDSRLIAALRCSRVLQDAPESVIQRALALFPAKPRAAAGPAAGGALRRLVAVLGFDSATLSPQAAGVRSAGAAARQMLYQSEWRDIDLRIALGRSGWEVSGQVLGPDASGWVELECDGFRTEQDWNHLSEFRLDGVPAGAWHIVLHSDSWMLELPELRVPCEGG